MSEIDNDRDSILDEIKIHQAEAVDLPVEGVPYKQPVEILVEAAAWTLMNQHARENLRHEAGGIMLGEIYRHEDTTAIRITTAVPAREAVNSMASIQFTYNAWSQMEKERQQRAPSEKLIGWYHTHPGFTAFFSDTDQFMHEHFFTQPWHVALVIDPINAQHRFYRWEEGQVREAPEFLLQVVQWPGPQPPLDAVLSQALREAATQAELSEDEPGRQLGTELRKLVGSLERGLASHPLEALLPFVVACSELPPEAVAGARRKMQEIPTPDSPIEPGDLAAVSSNQDPEGAITIAYGWLVQSVDRRNLHIHAVDESQSFCTELALGLPLADIAIEEGVRVLVLPRDANQQLYRLEPPLTLLRDATRAAQREGSRHLTPVEIDWQGEAPSGRIGKILAARHTLYALTRNELLVLSGAGHSPGRPLRLEATHEAQACGWSSFTDLGSWTTDLTGNLFLLGAKNREVWKLDRLSDRWSRFVDAHDLEDPLGLAAGMSTLSLFDAASGSIVQYSSSDGRLLCKRRLRDGLDRLKVWNLFSDGYQRLYLVSDRYVYQTR